LVGALDTYIVDDVEITEIWKPEKCERVVEKGDFVRYHYSGFLENGRQFDTSYQRGKTYNTYVGTGWIIPGMDIALYGMCVQEKRMALIPAHLAYGENGSGADYPGATKNIPGNASIYFIYELEDIWNPSDEIETEIIEAAPCDSPVKESDFVRYHYNGSLPNGKMFHTSYQNYKTYDTYVGKGYLIKGVDKGLIGMCPGELRRIKIPPVSAYGKNGDGANIPGDSTIYFDIRLIDRHNPLDDTKIEIISKSDNCFRKVVSSDYVRFTYKMELLDGTHVIETDEGLTHNSYVGFDHQIFGLEKGLIGACAGEVRRLTIPPHHGYGERGSDIVPGSAVLIFYVTVIDFHNPKDAPEISKVTPIVKDDCVKLVAGEVLEGNMEVKLESGLVVYKKQNLFVKYNKYEQIPWGLYTSLENLCMHQTYHIVLPPHLAYGEDGVIKSDHFEESVPGSAVVHFYVKFFNSYPDLDKNIVAKCKDPQPTFETCQKKTDEFLTKGEWEECLSRCFIQGEPFMNRKNSFDQTFMRIDDNKNMEIDEDEFRMKFSLEHEEL